MKFPTQLLCLDYLWSLIRHEQSDYDILILLECMTSDVDTIAFLLSQDFNPLTGKHVDWLQVRSSCGYIR